MTVTREIVKSRGLVRTGDRRRTTEIFKFVSAHQASYPVKTICGVLEVSTSGYYAWRQRQPSRGAQEDQRLLKRILSIHERSKGTYGAPHIHAELAEESVRVGRKRVARLMRAEHLRGVSRRKAPRITQRKPGARLAPDLVKRNFTASGPDRLWVADVTYVPPGQVGYTWLSSWMPGAGGLSVGPCPRTCVQRWFWMPCR